MASTLSPNMSLVVPAVGSEPSPTWAQDLNADLSILDGHNHSVGSGVQIQPNGININADLSFNSNNATALRTTRFTTQLSPIPNTGVDVGEVYVSGNELYYNDVTGGHQVQITTNGSVNAGAGSITGLPSGTASASFSAGTFVWQSATSTAANMDFGSAIMRNSGASSKSLTLQPPAAMAANIVETLPAIPSSQSFMTIDPSGNMSGYASINQGISRSNQVAVGQQISSSCGSFSTTSTTAVDVTNLTVTITTSGRPVFIGLQATNSGGNIQIASTISGGSTCQATFQFLRATSAISVIPLTNIFPANTEPVMQYTPGSFWFLDTPSAGTYTYKFQCFRTLINQQINVTECVLLAYEL